jgi:hypothetical protein
MESSVGARKKGSSVVDGPWCGGGMKDGDAGVEPGGSRRFSTVGGPLARQDSERDTLFSVQGRPRVNRPRRGREKVLDPLESPD